MVVPLPQDPTPADPAPGPLQPDVPGRPPEPVDEAPSDADIELDEELDETFPSSDPPASWAGPDIAPE
jgi:hypothetical protein